jgi:hypothetical protein
MEMLTGLAQVIARIPETAPIRYLSPDEVGAVMAANVYTVPEISAGAAINVVEA